MRFRPLRRGRLGSRLGHGQNLDTADFLADVAHGNSVGTGPGDGGVAAALCVSGSEYLGGSRCDYVTREAACWPRTRWPPPKSPSPPGPGL
jgi:hypothetical protein